MFHLKTHTPFDASRKDGKDVPIPMKTLYQYLQFSKAEPFSDEKAAEDILKAGPFQQPYIRKFGHQVKGFNEATWVSKRLEIMRDGVIFKIRYLAAAPAFL